MAPAAILLPLLLLGAGAEAAPSRRLQPPYNILSFPKRAVEVAARYYGSKHGLSRPASLPQKRDLTLPDGWSYAGCVTESYNERLLQGFSFSSEANTPLLCVTECAKRGFAVAGTEYADECYCANSLNGNGGATVGDDYCTTPCSGDGNEMCGHAWYLSLYTYNITAGDLYCGSSIAQLPSTAIPLPTTSEVAPTTTSAGPSSDFAVPSPTDTVPLPSATANGTETSVLPTTTSDSVMPSSSETVLPSATNATESLPLPTSTPISDAESSTVIPTTAEPTSVIPSSTVIPTTTVEPSVTQSSTVIPTTTVESTSVPPTTSTGAIPPSSTHVPPSSGEHAVWAHHMVGNTYPYTSSDWSSDISEAAAQGIDGFALNLGHESWQQDRIVDAYAAAQAAGGFKLFLSFDMTSMSCSSAADAATLVGLVKKFGATSAQATYAGKVLVSTFSGEHCTFGSGSLNGWSTLFTDVLAKDGMPVFFVPSVFTSPTEFDSYTWMNGELNWNSAWPVGDTHISSSTTDNWYITEMSPSQSYMSAVSPFFFTHYGANSWNKNWIYKSDDWLYATRWEDLIALRDRAPMTEILTWNDYGESSYIGPIRGAMPGNAAQWVDGFDHTGLAGLTQYYSTAFKTGAYPSITKDSIVMWSRPHPAGATASSDPVPRPTGAEWSTDFLWAVVMTSAPATVTLTSGSTSETFSVQAGLTKLKLASAEGGIGGSIARDGATVASYESGNAFQYTNNPVTYNFNYFVGGSS